MSQNLYIAYAITWAIHGVYFVYLWRRYARLKNEAGRV